MIQNPGSHLVAGVFVFTDNCSRQVKPQASPFVNDPKVSPKLNMK